MWSLPQRLGTTAVIACDPFLDGAHAAAESRGNRGSGTPLDGEDDGLIANPDPLAVDRLGQTLQFFEGKMVANIHEMGLQGQVGSP